jgi:uncharacterized protein (DUF4415 family)
MLEAEDWFQFKGSGYQTRFNLTLRRVLEGKKRGK